MSSDNYVNFERDPVRPLARSADGRYLFVANTPANCLEIYRARHDQLTRISAVPVGMDPVAVAVRNDHEVWVVNHMSDSVSIVDIKGRPRVTQTLMVGDEPRDIVFAGPQQQRGFITTARRGQHRPDFSIDDLRTPGIGRADVWVFDGAAPSAPQTILSLFTDTPSALAVSPDGQTVYAAVFLTGNKTTAIFPQAMEQGKVGPHASVDGAEAPETGVIVRYNGESWVDGDGIMRDGKVRFSLPDKDVFAIDAGANPAEVTGSWSGVGSVILNMAVNPATGAVYASNTEALNDIRFEGPGERSTTVRGRFVKNQVTVIQDDSVSSVHLNEHIDFSLPMGQSVSASDKERSLAQPMSMAVTGSGETMYLATFSSGKIAQIQTSSMESGDYDPYSTRFIKVPGGPVGLVLGVNEQYLYVYSRFDNQLSVVETASQEVVNQKDLYNPEPIYVREGRPFMHDAMQTSSNGTVSCGSCHIFGDNDGLAWDLGNPDEHVVENPLEESPGNLAPLKSRTFHPMKGPMTTQTFRGISLSGPMHWRGDRTGVNREIVNGVEESVEAAVFKEFRVAFPGLLGRDGMLPEWQLQKLTDFALGIQSRPNPVRNLDNTLTPRQAQGQSDYYNAALDRGVASCNSCHKLDAENGLFGTDKKITSEGPLVSQDFKIPHLRNMYQKVGMFGTSYLGSEHMGDQVRGFGYGHDGTFASLDDFLLKLGGFVFDSQDQALRISEFVWAFDAEQAPAVG
ncbi:MULTISPECIES: YncE family protein [unclassified Endozoicomonas]|uniref:YncE family protein n=1 Tax=unclassified Endozoicomonas TaxID=2644528 RepID=UPI003BB6F7CA